MSIHRGEAQALERRTPARAAAAAAREQRLYDSRLLSDRLTYLRGVRASGDLRAMMDAVRSDLVRNLANMTNRCEPANHSVRLPLLGAFSISAPC